MQRILLDFSLNVAPPRNAAGERKKGRKKMGGIGGDDWWYCSLTRVCQFSSLPLTSRDPKKKGVGLSVSWVPPLLAFSTFLMEQDFSAHDCRCSFFPSYLRTWMPLCVPDLLSKGAPKVSTRKRWRQTSICEPRTLKNALLLEGLPSSRLIISRSWKL